MASMNRSITSFRRTKARFQPQPRVLVICEDSKSCVTYLQEAARYYRADLQVKILHCGRTDPQGIVAEAIKLAVAYDHVYCAIDRDDHPLFDATEQRIRDLNANVKLRPSFPCYEFWLLLHFGKVRSPYTKSGSHSAGELCVRDLCAKAEMATYAKGNPSGIFQHLLPRLLDAKRWAAEVLLEAEADGARNPSTTLHQLLETFESLGMPILIN